MNPTSTDPRLPPSPSPRSAQVGPSGGGSSHAPPQFFSVTNFALTSPVPLPLAPCQVCVAIPSPGLRPSPLQSPPPAEVGTPDLECWVCYSHFNNVFRCPKMLECKHTFCLECLARINVKSAQPAAICCPLCRRLTPLPALGLPKLATDADVLASLPAAMQRVYSVRFQRNKGKLQIKRISEGRRCTERSLDVGLPSPPLQNVGHSGGVGGALFRLTGQPLCRALLLTLILRL
ncbi:RING finger protein 223 isoform X2 [Syngnathoides biaculeatus]|uniref:RING finger protein 223 isoform X2 n=1 Tax=Syngnathoides biaculeatus TaxID=300417 RepID=UPI002ADDD9EF|nr:RING finger protein 223 isoform X2 [Syngnathoides biaculeatus]